MLGIILSTIAILISAGALFLNLFQYVDKKKHEKLNLNVVVKLAGTLRRDFGPKKNLLILNLLFENNSNLSISISKIRLFGDGNGSINEVEAEFSKKLISTLKNGEDKYPLFTDKLPINIPAHVSKSVLIQFQSDKYLNWFLFSEHKTKLEVLTNKGIVTNKTNLEDVHVEFEDFLHFENVM